ncbi:conserved hypothetical protein (plasmid) [Borreliella bissettiae DN127]|uniref:Uncharacterized protein n=1 Tax=Borrelia bissettiae (strain DSM 17990 / CIP 109136 / DN127) TaxID=521010 RepID=G0ANP9_BORBD|nr:conserved hypothetical protein [Borreliella bissettiae DN127]
MLHQPVNCKIKRNEDLISKVFENVNKCELEIRNYKFKKKDISSNYREEYLMAHNFNEETFIKLVEDLVERSDFYSSGVEFN